MRILVTGAAGFIGSHATRHLHGLGHEIVATDVVEPAAAWRICGTLRDQGVHYLDGPLADVIDEAVTGVDEVWHFAANADIPLGARDTAVDLRESVLLTQRVLEALPSMQAPLGAASDAKGNHAGALVEAVATCTPSTSTART